jgi:hypothetical protein
MGNGTYTSRMEYVLRLRLKEFCGKIHVYKDDIVRYLIVVRDLHKGAERNLYLFWEAITYICEISLS